MIEDDKEEPCIMACVEIFCDDCPFGKLGEKLTEEEADWRTREVMKK
jgi:hypothetical protein